MKGIQKILLLALTIVAVGCNEQVSPDLQSSSASAGGGTTGSTTGGGPAVIDTPPPPSYYFKVENTSDTLLNYKLHKTGAGNATAECIVGSETSNTTQLSSDEYRTTPATYDISCFFEAEELAMFYNGLSFKIEASSNTCDYIAYAPFSYYNYMPGTSTGTYTQVVCDSATVANAAPALVATCGTTTGPGAAFASPSDNSSLCRFDYSDTDGAPNCDEGTITINTTTYTWDTTSLSAVAAASNQTIKCGGKVYNCAKGPIRQFSELNTATSGSMIYRPEVNTAVEKEFTLPKLLGADRQNSLDYANYRRNLASTAVNFSDNDTYNSYRTGSDPGTGLPILDPTYIASFAGIDTYSPTLIDNYARNLRMDGSTPVIATPWPHREANYYSRPLAAEPFIGSARVNPFYTFYCLDSAWDIKARIRMSVREWDRVLASSDLTLISDINLGATARMDNPVSVEVPNDFDGFNNFNDNADWDDLIAMERTTGVYNPLAPAATEWYPVLSLPPGLPAATTRAWFSTSIFPNDADD